MQITNKRAAVSIDQCVMNQPSIWVLRLQLEIEEDKFIAKLFFK